MKKQILILSLSLLASLASSAQTPYGGQVRVAFSGPELEGQAVTLRAEIDPGALVLGRNDMVTFTAVLRSLDGSRSVAFAPVAVAGTRRAKILRRSDYFNGAQRISADNFHVQGSRSRPDGITLEYTAPFEKWMRRSEFIVIERASGCCDDALAYADGKDHRIYSGGPGDYPPPYEPALAVRYLTPEAEPIKIVEETYTAALNFQSGKSDLLRDFRSNALVLSGVDDIVNRIRTDSLLTIRGIAVRGYASPEGSSAGNLRLSQQRAQAFVGYLHWKHGFYEADRIITAEGMGEDWNGLRGVVAASRLEDKERIIAAIDNNPDPDRRKAAIKVLSGGRIYRTLLNEYYPQLRRNEYTISYEVRGFNAREAAALIGARPQLLSLNEMFMVAELYEHDSPEFKRVFDVAARMYPDSPVARFNAAAMEIENGSYDTAIARLEDVDSPGAWNNLGVALWHKGNHDKAGECLRKAAGAGDDTARRNLAEFDKWFEDRDE